MKCMNHVDVEATGACRECGNLYCDSCLMKVGNKNVCQKCAAELMEKQYAPSSAQSGAPVIVVQQQQQQQQHQPTGVLMADPRRGSVGWLIFWIIFFWPIAIWYYFARIRPYSDAVVVSPAPSSSQQRNG